MTTDNDPENDIDPKRRTTITAIGSLGVGLASVGSMSGIVDGRYGRDRRRGRRHEREHGRGGGCGRWCRGHGTGRSRDRGRGYERDHPHYDDETRWDGDDEDDWRDDDGSRRHGYEEETDDEREAQDEDTEADEGDDRDDQDDGGEDTEDERRDSTPDGESDGDDEPREGIEEEKQPEDEEQGDGDEEPEEEEGDGAEDDEERDESEDQEREVDAGASDVAGRMEARIHAEVNGYRAENGLNALSFDEALADVARNHSRDMNDHDYFSHDAPDGSGPGDRLDAADIDCSGWAENIAYEYDSSFGAEDADSVADSIVQGWIGSPGHRENILGDYDEQGIGVDIGDDGRVMATQLFCTSG